MQIVDRIKPRWLEQGLFLGWKIRSLHQPTPWKAAWKSKWDQQNSDQGRRKRSFQHPRKTLSHSQANHLHSGKGTRRQESWTGLLEGDWTASGDCFGKSKGKLWEIEYSLPRNNHDSCSWALQVKCDQPRCLHQGSWGTEELMRSFLNLQGRSLLAPSTRRHFQEQVSAQKEKGGGRESKEVRGRGDPGSWASHWQPWWGIKWGHKGERMMIQDYHKIRYFRVVLLAL